jgi:hypothetical protein
VRRIDAIVAIDREINGATAEQRFAIRKERVKPLVGELEEWMRAERARLSRHADLAKAIDYMVKRWPAFTRFLDDGRICLSNNAAERALRGIAIARSFCPYRAGGRGPLSLAPTLWAPSSAQYIERRAGGDVVHVEVGPGVVIVVAAWMLDPAACAGMSLGAPRVTLAALAELDQLLTERGFRRSSRDDPTIVQEERHEELDRAGSAIRAPAPAQHPVRFDNASYDVPFGVTGRRCAAGQPSVGGRQHRGRGG